MKNNYKVLVFKGTEISLQAKPMRGNLTIDDMITITTQTQNYQFHMAKDVQLRVYKGVGTYIELQLQSESITITVPRLYIDIGNGFGLINRYATRRLYKILQERISKIGNNAE